MRCWLSLLLIFVSCFRMPAAAAPQVVPGAARLDAYLPALAGKRVALLINQTSRVGDSLLLDVLRNRGVGIVKIFVPEHGFRGTADAGAHVASGRDAATGLPVISLYGDHKKPTAAELADVDVLVYDLQDVGVRFYTYISTLQYALEACAAAGKDVLVLDRPNPNGFYVDGPVLDTALRSFVGMQPVPIVYGMTAGEYARMLVGERWFPGAAQSRLQVISCTNYDHKTHYQLPVPPSPNLKTPAAVLLYPSLCLFEGTVVSVGRGTDKPFQQWGHPEFSLYPEGKIVFTPQAVTGASKPLYEGQACQGILVAETEAEALHFVRNQFQLQPLLQAYGYYGRRPTFFNAFFEKLAGTRKLREQVTAGTPEAAIRATWKPGIDRFKAIRRNYLLYRDFE